MTPSNTSLLTDLYQLTSAYALYKAGRHNDRACYHMFFRSLPFGGGYAVAAGLAPFLEWLRNFHFDKSDLIYLAGLTGNDGQPLFDHEFLYDFLANFQFKCDIDAVPEGTVVFAHEPLVRVKGTMVENLLIETALLCFVNSQTLWATKAARICQVAAGEPVLEFGLRRAQGVDGSLSATRAAYIGGVDATSNVLAGKLYGIPVKGTHPHGFVMLFDTEMEAFETYARALPNNCVFLVDTYDTLEGVRHAIEVCQGLQERGYKPIGIRLDSGDLAYLAQRAREMLDEADMPLVQVFASNDLDERIMASLKAQKAPIAVWGVGTKLVSAYDQPALGGVFKMGAVWKNDGWVPKIKVSEQIAKTTNPGVLQVLRFFSRDNKPIGDMLCNEPLVRNKAPFQVIDPLDPTRSKTFPEPNYRPLLVPTVLGGTVTHASARLSDVRWHARSQIASLDPAIRRLDNPHQYPVGLDPDLYALKLALIKKARGHES